MNKKLTIYIAVDLINHLNRSTFKTKKALSEHVNIYPNRMTSKIDGSM